MAEAVQCRYEVLTWWISRGFASAKRCPARREQCSELGGSISRRMQRVLPWAGRVTTRGGSGMLVVLLPPCPFAAGASRLLEGAERCGAGVFNGPTAGGTMYFILLACTHEVIRLGALRRRCLRLKDLRREEAQRHRSISCRRGPRAKIRVRSLHPGMPAPAAMPAYRRHQRHPEPNFQWDPSPRAPLDENPGTGWRHSPRARGVLSTSGNQCPPRVCMSQALSRQQEGEKAPLRRVGGDGQVSEWRLTSAISGLCEVRARYLQEAAATAWARVLAPVVMWSFDGVGRTAWGDWARVLRMRRAYVHVDAFWPFGALLCRRV